MIGLSDVMHALENETLSSALTKLEFFARRENYNELAAWAKQERIGDFSLVAGIDMPKYREVIVIWFDINNQPIRIPNLHFAFIYQNTVGEGVEELEQKTEEGVRIASPKLVDILRRNGFQAAYYDVKPTEIKKVLTAIRNEALMKLAPITNSSTKGFQMSTNTQTVFIVHGRNSAAVVATKQFLRAIGLEGKDFSAYRSDMGGTVHITEVVRKAFKEAQAIIVLWTPDEYAALNPKLVNTYDKPTDIGRWQPRPNVIFEAGAALLEHYDRTIVIGLGNAEVPSDMSGLHLVHMSNAGNKRMDLKNLLLASGCESNNSSNSDYLTADVGGDFEKCITSLEVGIQSPFRES